MAERTHSVELLKVCLETCNAALDHISNKNTRALENNGDPRPSLAVIHKDFISLLSLIYASTTKLALVLKPSSPTYSAAVTPLNDLIKHISALSHCVKLFSPDEDGSVLTQEASDVATGVIEAMKAFLKALSEAGQSGEYLVRVGTIHDLIETARSSSGLSKDNISAVRKKWIEDTEPLEDGVRELKELIDNAGDDEGDDGWDELGLEPDVPLSEKEADRASKVHLVLRLSALLHKKISSDILGHSPDTNIPSYPVLDQMPSLSRTLLSVADELIAAAHSPQDCSALRDNLCDLEGVLKDVNTLIGQFFPEVSVEEGIGGLSLKDGEPGKRIVKKKKWFNGCSEQLDKAIRTAEATLSDPEVQ
ncbi:hypothetical protein V5O48_000335 [Marasmius crinis-equi]|uniref:Cyclin-D1-binding protein 1 n=1 Tax=Marasmius crinis-equi TaxID=585013 RepID=A0ABR3G245_9AGAR